MKLGKPSLAAVLALGAFSHLSSAPLEEAIKDIDVSGFGRYRFESTRNKWFYDETKSHQSSHRFTLDVNFKASLDDNFFSVISLRYDADDFTGSHKNYASGLTNDGWVATGSDLTSFSVREYYVGFSGITDTTVLFGRQPAGLYFTDDVVATGLKVLNTSIPGISLVGTFYTNFEADEDLGNIFFSYKDGDEAYIHQKNLWSVAAVGSYEWFSFQAWYAGLHKVADLFAAELAANYALSDDVSLRAKAQISRTSLKNTFKNNRIGPADPERGTDVKSSNFFGITAGLSAYGLDADLGFATYGKKDYNSFHTIEDKGALIKAGERALDYTKFVGKHDTWFAKLLYTYDAYSAGIDYVYDKAKNDERYEDIKSQEWVFRLGYKYNSKLDFKAWYSMITEKHTDDVSNHERKSRSDKFRFEARYNF